MNSFKGVENRAVPSTLRGFRQWNVVWHPGPPPNDKNYRVTIQSLNGTPWPNGELTAECTLGGGHRLMPRLSSDYVAYALGPHKAPHYECSCGIYALSFQEDWTSISSRIFGSYYQILSGVAKFGGRVQFGTLGFRAAQAKIEAIHILPPQNDVDIILRERFKLTYPDILVFSDLDMMYRQYPPDDFSSLYPKEVQEKMASDIQNFRLSRGGGGAKTSWLSTIQERRNADRNFIREKLSELPVVL